MFRVSKKDVYRTGLASIRRSVFMAVGLSALVNILMLTGPLFMLQLYDRVLSSGSIPTLQTLFFFVVAAYAFLGLYDFLRNRIMSRAAFRLDNIAASKAFSFWVGLGAKNAQRQAITRPLHDLAIVRGFLSSPAVLGIFDLPWAPFFLVVIYIIHPWLGLLAIGGAIIAFLLALGNQLATRGALARAMQMDAQESAHLEQLARNGESIVPMGMVSAVTSDWQKSHAGGLREGQVGSDRGEAFTASSKAFRMLLQSSLLGLGGYLALNQEISPGMIVAASIIGGRALAPIDQVIGQWRSISRARMAHSRLKATMQESVDGQDVLQLPDPQGNLDVVGVTKYPPQASAKSSPKPILSGLRFNLQAGDGLGVIGPSASGKTSLARLLVGAWQSDEGDVRLDGASLDQWNPEVLGKYIGYLPQNVELLPGTIADNIARFSSDRSDEDIINAAQLASVHDMIVGFPEGYETHVGVGRPLSGGQVQRIGLARALFRNPHLIVLDEPNSNLDSDGDAALTRAISQMREVGSVIIVMAHRPSAIAAVNKLLVLKDGRVADFGEKADVMARAIKPAASAVPAQAAQPDLADVG